MVVIDMDMPKSCEDCKAICSRFNGNETIYYCGLTDLFIANYSEDLCEPRDVNCPIKCDIKDIKAEIQKSKLWKGFSKYPNARKHDVGLDRYYDMGLDKALAIIDKYMGDM